MRFFFTISLCRSVLIAVVLFRSLFLANSPALGQPVRPDSLRIPGSALTFLTIAPDARSAGMGEAGAASSPDANAAYWNGSKLVFAEKDFGVSASYTPLLNKLTEGSWLGYASVYKKFGKGHALAISANYFTNKDAFPNLAVGIVSMYQAKDLALNTTYAKQFGKNFSLGLTLKYISASVDVSPIINGVSFTPNRSMAGDLSAFYRKQLINEESGRRLSWAAGAIVSNLGGKMRYSDGRPGFLPTTLRIGGSLSYSPNQSHQFNFIMDASKLMVPTPLPGMNVNNKPLLSGTFNSFSDAPGGFREELQEVIWAGGAEYKYKNTFSLRGGYLGASRYKDGRKYFTAGAGLRILKSYDVDFAYMFPMNDDSPFANTFRISLSAYLHTKGADKKI